MEIPIDSLNQDVTSGAYVVSYDDKDISDKISASINVDSVVEEVVDEDAHELTISEVFA